MTLNFTEMTLPSRRDDQASAFKGHVMIRSSKPNSTPKPKGRKDEDLEKDRWENEGGANPNQPSRILNFDRDSLDQARFTHQINLFYELMDDGAYDKAAKVISHAAEKYCRYREQIRESFDHAVSVLSTLNGPAYPPHPQALPLVIKKRDMAL